MPTQSPAFEPLQHPAQRRRAAAARRAGDRLDAEIGDRVGDDPAVAMRRDQHVHRRKPLPRHRDHQQAAVPEGEDETPRPRRAAGAATPRPPRSSGSWRRRGGYSRWMRPAQGARRRVLRSTRRTQRGSAIFTRPRRMRPPAATSSRSAANCVPYSRAYRPLRASSCACLPVSTIRPAIHDADQIGADHGREAVRDDDRGAAAHQTAQRRLHLPLRIGVERRGRLVEQQDRRVLQHRARDGDALPLAAREPDAVLADRRVVALRQVADEVVGARRARGGLDLGVGRAEPAIGDIGAHGVVEQADLLRRPARPRRAARRASPADFLPVDQRCGRHRRRRSAGSG